MKRHVLGVVLVFLVVGPVRAREVSITILHTCDLHGHILPTEDYAGTTNVGGLARCATVIRDVRSREKNVLLVDAGDTIQGTALSHMSDGKAMVRALNLLRYDAWVWGNHEFDWGLKKLAGCAELAEMPILNANVAGMAKIRPYILREVDGVKVAIIGLNTPGIPNWSRPRLLAGLQFEDSLATLAKIVPQARSEGARVLALVCHQGFKEGGDDHANQVREIARNFPELDVIIGGHTHRDIPEFMISKILYSQADHHGIHLGRVDVVYDTETGRVTKRRANTLLMDERVTMDAELLRLLGPDIDRSEKTLNQVIGTAAREIDQRTGQRRETPLHALFFEAIVAAFRKHGVKVEAVVHGLLDRQTVIHKGSITVGDVWRIVPYENTLGICRLSAAELREVLDENAGTYGTPAFRGIWGLRWAFDPDAPAGKRTATLTRPDGSPIGATEKIAVAFNSYDLASGGLRWKKLRELADKPSSELVEYDFQTREAVIDYIRDTGTITPKVAGWWKMKRIKAG